MIVLYIILSIILIIFILLHFSIVLYAELSNDKSEIKVKYLFFTLYPLKEKKEKKKRVKKLSKQKQKKLEKELEEERKSYEELLQKANTNTSTENEEIPKEENLNKPENEELKEEEPDEFSENVEEKPDKYSNIKKKINEYKEKWEMIKPYVPLAKKAFKKLIKAIRITDIYIDLKIANEDAYDCAMNYGRANMAIYETLGIISSFFTMSIKKTSISCKFNSSDTEYDFSCKVKTRPSTLIAIAVSILVKFIYTTIKMRLKEKRMNKEMLKNE